MHEEWIWWLKKQKKIMDSHTKVEKKEGDYVSKDSRFRIVTGSCKHTEQVKGERLTWKSSIQNSELIDVESNEESQPQPPHCTLKNIERKLNIP